MNTQPKEDTERPKHPKPAPIGKRTDDSQEISPDALTQPLEEENHDEAGEQEVDEMELELRAMQEKMAAMQRALLEKKK